MSYEDQRFAIRFSPRARRELDEARVRLAEITDPDHAYEWYNGFLDALALLADNPNRNAVAYESRFFRETVHAFSYRLTVRGVAYRVFYTITEPKEDAPIVSLMHIRHASRKPMTRREAREIETDTQ